MRFCSNCFKDQVIIELINSNSRKILGKCNYCGRNNVLTFSSEDIPEITELFENFIDNFSLIDEVDIGDLQVDPKTISKILNEDWNIFSDNISQLESLIESICFNICKTTPRILKEPIVLAELYDLTFVEQNTFLNKCTWKEFVDLLKYDNRFFTNLFNHQIFDRILPFLVKEYNPGIEFFRGRFANYAVPLLPEEMGAPPRSFASSGRANAEGISCLYLANDINTTFYELKARTFDYVSVGTFQALQHLKVIDLKRIHTLSPLELGDKLSLYTLNRRILEDIGSEIAKPLKRQDSVLDYIPTQYIADYIKSKGYDGIEYKSTINGDGYNIAIFNTEKFACINSVVFEIGKIKYEESKQY